MGASGWRLIREAGSQRQVPFCGHRKSKTGPERGRPATVACGAKQSGSSRMPRYFFHVRDADGEVSRDQEGQDLPDLEAARIEAISANREMLGERLLHGGSLNHRQIEIADETGKALLTIAASDVLLR